uniref:Uncharacterized protein n=1 Tax=viral metagenome TaxID=1070528 RepID=A0A6C0JSC4_9ZZZZ
MSKVEQKRSIIISPFCILHYNDPATSTFFGFINYPTRIQTHTGKELLECTESPPQYGNWKITGSFYAFSPMIRPIPTGLKLINAKKLGKDPWGTENVKYAYDPFDIQNDAVSFMTWTQQVPATVPLYLHITPTQTSYPSFDPKPPCDPTGWTQDKLSPIYVLVNPLTHPSKVDSNLHKLPEWKMDINNRPIFRFRGSDNRCIPDVNGVTIEKCFLMTDEDILHINDHFGPITLLTRLKLAKNKAEKKRYIGRFFRKLPPYAIMIGVSLFILSLIACIIILSN